MWLYDCCIIQVSCYITLPILSCRFYKCDPETSEILSGFAMHGKSVWYALEESVQGSQLILHPTVRQLLTLKFCFPGSFVWFSCLKRSKHHHFFPYSSVFWGGNGGVCTISRCTYFLLDIQHKKPTLARFWWTPKCCVKAYGRPLKISVPWKPWKIAPWTQRLW